MVPIARTRRAEQVPGNVAAADVVIEVGEMTLLSEVFAPGIVVGERYAAADAGTVL
jgi:hypothetical protein